MDEKVTMHLLAQRFGITSLNPMQLNMLKASKACNNICLYSPTGTGKTIAYLLPLLGALSQRNGTLQSLILVPTRELAMQVGQVLRPLLRNGHHVTLCYGGHRSADELSSIQALPSVIVATPGRLVDLCKRGVVTLTTVKMLVVDEVDKMTELGFENDLHFLIKQMSNLKKQVLTSATHGEKIPDFMCNNDATILDYCSEKSKVDARISKWIVKSEQRDKIGTLCKLLPNIVEENGKTIVFVNYRDAVSRVSSLLASAGIENVAYHGALDQIEREKAVAMLNNGTYRIMVTTDLGARGLDIDNVTNIVHYHLPVSEDIFTHRNGRTARVDAQGSVWVITGDDEPLPVWIDAKEYHLPLRTDKPVTGSEIKSLWINSGRHEKISRGDVLGWILKNVPQLTSEDVGKISVGEHYTIVALPASKIDDVISVLKSTKLKGNRVKISIA